MDSNELLQILESIDSKLTTLEKNSHNEDIIKVLEKINKSIKDLNEKVNEIEHTVSGLN